MFKNFRTQLTPLAQSPTVSNIRGTGARISRHEPRSIQATTKSSTIERHAWEQHSHQQQLLQISYSTDTIPNAFATGCDDFAETWSLVANWRLSHFAPSERLNNEEYNLASSTLFNPPDTILDNFDGTCPQPASLRSPQTAPNYLLNTVEHISASSSPYPARIAINDGVSTPSSQTPSVISEPYWLATSDVASSCTTQTAWTPRHRCFVLRESRRHNKNTGLKCPQPECRMKPPMRSGNLKRHLLDFHKMSRSEIQAAKDEAISSAR